MKRKILYILLLIFSILSISYSSIKNSNKTNNAVPTVLPTITHPPFETIQTTVPPFPTKKLQPTLTPTRVQISQPNNTPTGSIIAHGNLQVNKNNDVEIAAQHLIDYLKLKDRNLVNFEDYSTNGKYIEFSYDYDTYAVNIKDNSILKYTINPDDPLGGASYEYYKATCEVDGVKTKKYEKVYNKSFVSKDGSEEENEVARYIIWLPQMVENSDINKKINIKLKQYNKDLYNKYDTMAKKHMKDHDVIQSIKINDCVAAIYVYYFDVKYYVTRYDDEIITFLISGYDFDSWEETLSFSTKTGKLLNKTLRS